MTTLQDLFSQEVEAFDQSPTQGTPQSAPTGPAEPKSAAQGAPASPSVGDGGQVEAPASNPAMDFMLKTSPLYQIGRQGVDFMEKASAGFQAGGAKTPEEAAAATSLDMASYGSVDNLIAAYDSVKKLVVDGDKNMMQNFEDRKQEVNLALHHNRKDFPGASLKGDVSGGLLGGFGFGMAGAKLLRSVPALNRLTAGIGSIPTAAGVGALEAGIYRFNSDGSMEEIASDATLGAIGGAAIGTLMKGGVGGWLISRVKGDVPRAQMELGKELYAAMSTKEGLAKAIQTGAPPNAPMDPTELVARLGKTDADLMIADVYPGLERYVREVVNYDLHNPGRKLVRLRDIIASRNNAEMVYADAARRVVADGNVITPTAYKGTIQNTMEQLRPQYEAMWQDLNARGVKVKGGDVMRMIEDLAEGDPRIDTSASYFKEAMSTLKNELRANKVKSPKSGTAGRKDKRVLKVTPQSLHNIKREFGKRLGSSSNDIMRGNALVYDSLKKVLEDLDPRYAQLSSTYADAGAAAGAYKAGQRLFGKDLLSPEDFHELTARFRSTTEGDAFVNGAKFALWNNIKGRTTAEAVRKAIADNEPRLDLLKSILGDSATQELVDNLTTTALRENTDKVVDAAERFVRNPSKVKDLPEVMRNLSIMLGEGSQGAAQKNALFRMLRGNDTPATQAGRAALLDDTLSGAAGDAPAILKSIERLAKGGNLPNPVGPNAMMAGGLVGGGQDILPGISNISDMTGSWIAEQFGAGQGGEQPPVQRQPAPTLEQMLRREQKAFPK